MTEKHLKKCSTSLLIREMQIKTTLRFSYTSVRKAKIKNSGDKSAVKDVEVGLQAGTTSLEISLVVPQKVIVRPENPVIPLLAYTRKRSTRFSLIYNSWKLERTQMSLNRGMDT